MASVSSDEEKMFQAALELDAADRPADAMKLLQPLAARQDNPRHLLAYAHCLVRAGGEWKVAADCLKAALVIEPKYLEGGMRLFLADLFIKNGFKSEAIEQWRVVARMPPDGTGYGAVPDEAIIMLKRYEV